MKSVNSSECEPSHNTCGNLNIVVALACEAKPIIDFLQLKKVEAAPFARYWGTIHGVDSEINVQVVVSGIGQIAMAAAVAWLAAKTKQKAAWLNLGVAGHAEHDLGTIVRIVCAQSEGKERAYYPPLVAKWRGANSASLSSNSANLNYPPGLALDMEVSTFYEVAGMFAEAECVQALKVVSDNPSSSIDDLNAPKISALIAPHVTQIIDFAHNLLGLVPMPKAQPKRPESIGGLRFTVNQELQLQEVLRRLDNLAIDSFLIDSRIASLRSASDVIAELDGLAEQHAPLIFPMVVPRSGKA